MTSLADGASQTHTATTLRQWSGTSAYFIGDAIKVQLIADPGTARSRVSLARVLAGPQAGGAIASICGPTDARQGIPVISDWRWFSNTAGASPLQDIFVVEVSDDRRDPWAEPETVGPAGFEVDGDGIVGITDFLILLAEWGPCPDPCPPACLGDLDGICSVDVNDLLILLANWTP
ncbi:MAG: hypothetical protein ACYTA3_09560 [Planctomycetota bacterium]|jgi:hypothetical protein